MAKSDVEELRKNYRDILSALIVRPGYFKIIEQENNNPFILSLNVDGKRPIVLDISSIRPAEVYNACSVLSGEIDKLKGRSASKVKNNFSSEYLDCIKKLYKVDPEASKAIYKDISQRAKNMQEVGKKYGDAELENIGEKTQDKIVESMSFANEHN